jgi:formylglycine-generating enzyme required for sulfatase activity
VIQQLLHPKRHRLENFARGNLAFHELEEIQHHLADCPDCCRFLDSVPDDDMLGLVRRAGTPVEATETILTSKELTADEVSSPAHRTPAKRLPTEVLDDLPPELSNNARYHVVELIGKGGMGDVYKAEHRLMERLVALKVIKRELTRNSQAVDRFRREVRAAAALTHNNIVAAYDADRAGDSHFLVMEYVEGTDLSKIVLSRGPLAVREACAYIYQAALGLQHAHGRGMVHRDIKPHNLMVTRDGTVKILDFGLASLSEVPIGASNEPIPHGALTSAGAIMGTPDYIAPEQATDARSADIRADIYSLGVTFYYLLTGQTPFDAGMVRQKLLGRAVLQARPIRAERPEVPAGVADIIGRMLAHDPAKRFQSPAQLADALVSFVPDHAGSARAIRQPSPWPTAAWILAVTSFLWMLVAAVVLVNVAWIRLQWPQPLAAWLVTSAVPTFLTGLCLLAASFRASRRTAGVFDRASAIVALLPINPLALALWPASLWVLSVLRYAQSADGAREHAASTAFRFGWLRLLLTAATTAAVCTAVIYIETDRAEVLVDVQDSSIAVHVSKQGQEVRILKDGKPTITVLPSGEYELSATGPDEVLRVTPSTITLARGDQKSVVVRAFPKSLPAERHAKYDDALKTADLWLRLVHTGKYEEAYEELASDALRKQVTKQAFAANSKATWEKLGPMGYSARPLPEFKATLPGVGPGEYMVFESRVPFARGNQIDQHRQRLTLVLADATWRVLDYDLQPISLTSDARVQTPSDSTRSPIANSIGMKLALIPAGEFQMGSPATEEGRKASWELSHRVKLTKPFYMGIYEVTQDEYRQVTDRDPFEFSPTGLAKKAVENLDTKHFPAETVSWEDARNFCRLLSERPAERTAGRKYRLPSEAEWEYACRAGTSTPNHFGKELTSELANVSLDDYSRSLRRPTTVGSYPPNPFGLYDMHGNVAEWVADWFEMDYFKSSPIENPLGPPSSRIMPNGGARTIKGASYVDPLQRLRSAYRNYRPPDLTGGDLGFRIVCEAQ